MDYQKERMINSFYYQKRKYKVESILIYYINSISIILERSTKIDQDLWSKFYSLKLK